jgi:hypothetical protein
MKPATDFPGQVEESPRASTAARTACHINAKALQDMADELTIPAAADQDRKALAMVEMQKIQHPAVPEGQYDGPPAAPGTVCKVLVHIYRSQGAIEHTESPGDQVDSTDHQPVPRACGIAG